MFLPLLVLLLPGSEADQAEKLFRAMEKKIVRAKTLQSDFECRIDNAPLFVFAGSGKGSMTLAEGNRFQVQVTISNSQDGKPVGKGMVTSDGRKLRLVGDETLPTQTTDTPKPSGALLRAAITRTGLFLPFYVLEENEIAVEEDFKVADFKLGSKEKIEGRQAQEIQYTLTIMRLPKALRQEPVVVSVWIDTKTNLPLKRVMTITHITEEAPCCCLRLVRWLCGSRTVKRTTRTITYTETWSKLTLNPKVDAKMFQLPRE
jgi:hypothetical protein